MEVILIKDLKRKGTFGDVIEVADGYARNFLIPNGYALAANKTNKKRFEEMKDKAMLDVTKLRDELSTTADQIKGKTFTMSALSRDGKLYGSITPTVIVNEVKNELPELKVNASDIIIEEGNIKYVGTYNCKAQFTKDISAQFTIVIESDETHEQPELLESILAEDELSDEDIDEDEDAIAEDQTDEVTSETDAEDIETDDVEDQTDEITSESDSEDTAPETENSDPE